MSLKDLKTKSTMIDVRIFRLKNANNLFAT